MKKILILSASTGSGHTRAASALAETAQQHFPYLEVKHIDVLDYLASPVKQAIFHSYDIMIKQIPELWSFLYKRSDNPALMKRLRGLTKKLNSINAFRLYAYIDQEAPDYIIATHFYGAQLVFSAPKHYQFPPVALVMTDYEKHAFLQMPGLDHYFVPTPRMAWKFATLGIEPARITTSGIPISPVFTSAKPRPLVGKNKHILLLSGGQGMANITKLCARLIEAKLPLTLTAIAGSNKRLKASLQTLAETSHAQLNVVGWTDAIQDYLEQADMVITKPGGLTTSECIAMKKPILATSPIPGQEEHNAEYILSKQYGVVVHSLDDLVYYVSLSPQEIAPGYTQTPQGSPAAEVILQTIVAKLTDS